MILEGMNGLGFVGLLASFMWIGYALIELFGKDQ